MNYQRPVYLFPIINNEVGFEYFYCPSLAAAATIVYQNARCNGNIKKYLDYDLYTLKGYVAILATKDNDMRNDKGQVIAIEQAMRRLMIDNIYHELQRLNNKSYDEVLSVWKILFK